MLIVIDVTQLVAHDARVANHGVDNRVRMAVDPHINATVSNEIAQFRGESSRVISLRVILSSPSLVTDTCQPLR